MPDRADESEARVPAPRTVKAEPSSAAGAAAKKTTARKATAGQPVAKKAVAGKRTLKKATVKKSAAKKKAPSRIPAPTYDVERELAAEGAEVIAGVDEVGRGAWAGPVVVGAAVTGFADPPAGLTDSKLLSPKRRDELSAALVPWVSAYAFGAAEPEEIDELGMTAALRLAAGRALAALPVRPDAVVLDGNHDYLGDPWRVRCVVKGDRSCVSVAAASVLAKVYRDAMMARLGDPTPEFAFQDNAGYPSPVHKQALAELGPTVHHRMSWAFLDDLPQWRHLKKVRRETPVDDDQLTLGF